MCFSDLCLVIHKSNFNNYKIVKNTSSMKQNNWTTSCTQNEAERARETLIWLESVTEKRDRKCSTWRIRRRFGAVLHRANGRAGNEAQEVVQSFQRDFAPSSHLPLCCPFHISLKTRCGVGTGSCGQFRRRNSLLILISSCFYSKMATSLSGHLPITPIRLLNVL